MRNTSASLFVLFATISLMNALPTRKCYTVAIEGGGSNGAWEAGCFLGMNNYLNKTLKYDAFSGISVGSIMSGSLAQYENLTEGIETTANLWLTITGHQQVWNYWPLGIKAGLWHHGFVNNQAESLELKFNITEDMKYPVYFGTVNALNGTFVRFQGRHKTKEYVRQSIMCSSAVPMLFPYQKDPELGEEDAVYFDGGTAVMIDLIGAINLCSEQGYTDEEIVLDSIYCTSAHLPMDWDMQKTYHPLEVFQRYKTIHKFTSQYQTFIDAVGFRPSVNYRYFMNPQHPLSSFPFGFEPQYISRILNEGLTQCPVLVQQQQVFHAEHPSISEFVSKSMEGWGVTINSQTIQNRMNQVKDRLNIYKQLKSRIAK